MSESGRTDATPNLAHLRLRLDLARRNGEPSVAVPLDLLEAVLRCAFACRGDHDREAK